jgi:REP element-mobilizing transposase RayT
MNRGNRKTRVFRDDEDCFIFLETIHNIVVTHGIEVHAYSLMPNHYHLLVRSVHGNLSAAMKTLGGRFTQRLNARHGWEGTVFRGRFKSQLVLDEHYLIYLLAYIHLNPLRANLVTRVDSEMAWTSHRSYIAKDRPPSWLKTTELLRRFDSKKALSNLILGLHRGSVDWPDILDHTNGYFDWQSLNTASAIPAQSQPDAVNVADLVAHIAGITGVSSRQLRKGVKGRVGNPARRFAVWALRKSTDLTQRQIGRVLRMSESHVSRDLRRTRERITEFQAWADEWNRLFPIDVKVSSVRA